MKCYEFGFSFMGIKETEIVEYEDDATEEQVRSDFEDWMSGRVDSWCAPVDMEGE